MMRMGRSGRLVAAAALVASVTALAGCGATAPGAGAPGLLRPTLLFRFPEQFSSPDGMTIGPDGWIYLSMNNKNREFKHPSKILRISPDDRYEVFSELPPHPETKAASPLGLAFGSDGHLYVSDNQMFVSEKRGLSRLLRVVVENGKAARVEVVATGLNMANGLACRGDAVYVCDTTLGTETPMPSGVYRFALADLKAGAPVAVTGLGDPRLILKILTRNPKHPVGANGLDFDAQGVMYVCNFGDAEVIRVTLGADGRVASSRVLAAGNGMESADGLHADDRGGIWVADFLGNAVVRIDAGTGAVRIVAKNAPCDGARGELHAPSECIRRGNKLYVSNIDITYGPNVRHDIHTMSLLTLTD